MLVKSKNGKFVTLTSKRLTSNHRILFSKTTLRDIDMTKLLKKIMKKMCAYANACMYRYTYVHIFMHEYIHMLLLYMEK